VRLSVSLRTSYPAVSSATAAGWIVERTRAARDAGLDALYVGDHHATGPDSAYFQNVPLLGRLLPEWGDRPFGGLFLVPLWHPVLLAEQIATLATLAAGRFVLQTALGDGATQFGAMGLTTATRVRRFEVGLGLVRSLLAGNRVTDDTGTFGITDACISPVPGQPVEVWIGATAAVGIERAARLGDGWECNAHVVPSEAREQLACYRDACAALGQAPGVAAIRRDVHVGVDAAAANAEADRVVAAGYRGFRREALTAGDVGQVTDAFGVYADMGYDEVVVRHFSEDHRGVLESLARLAEVRTTLR
jgi:alkanesulfonate monooxygenase SsuD/methylene tetrahydromethanopterin reductase-like flavin-dependent oxidoreductase (luciferase family)